MCNKIIFFLHFLFLINVSSSYKPVILLHGILTGAESMKTIEDLIQEKHPGTIVYNTDRFGGWSSLENAWHQVNEFGADLMEICAEYKEGVHLVGYSQGGLIARTVLETFVNHTVKNFISLSSPQAGQYGTAFLHMIFPDLMEKTAFELFYSHVGQHTSVGNYWNDPHHQNLYYKYSNFLPYINNELPSTRSDMYKDGLLKLDNMILIGGPDDGVITPWQSSHFGYYDIFGDVVPMEFRDIYKKDKIGLKTLKKDGKLKILTFPGVHHFDWHLNTTVIEKAILPYLD